MNTIKQEHHGSGDNVVGNKILHNHKVKKEEDIPLWLKYTVAIAAIFAIGWGIYIYLIPAS